MISAFDVPAAKLIEALKADLKDIIIMPEWAGFVKTGMNRQRPPVQEDWWITRAASLLRKLYVDGPAGVNRLRTWYGGRKDRGVKPERSYKAGGKIIRTLLIQLEKNGFVKQSKKGRELSPKGRSFIDQIAKKVK